MHKRSGYEDDDAGTEVVYVLFITAAGTREQNCSQVFCCGALHSIMGIIMESIVSCPFSLNTIGV
jgi:hypothetical protein